MSYSPWGCKELDTTEQLTHLPSRLGLLTVLGSVQGLRWLLMTLMSFSGPFSLASGGFLAAPPLISNSSNRPFATQGKS